MTDFFCEEAGFEILEMEAGIEDSNGAWKIKIFFPPFSPLFGEMMVSPSCLGGRTFKVNLYGDMKQFLLVTYVQKVYHNFAAGECTAVIWGKFLDNLEYLEWCEEHGR